MAAAGSRPPLAAETAAVVRARLSAAVPEMIEVIGRGVPEYGRQEHPDYSQRLAGAVTGAVAQFIAHLAQPGRSTQAITAEFRAIGGTAAREGRTLDALQDALRLGARVAWHWLCEADAGLDLRELSRVGEAIFAYLDEPASGTGSPRRYWPGCSSARTPRRWRSRSTSTRRPSGTGCGRSRSCSATSCAIRICGSSCSWPCGSAN